MFAGLLPRAVEMFLAGGLWRPEAPLGCILNPRMDATSTRCLYLSCCSSRSAWMALAILHSWLPLVSSGGPCRPVVVPAILWRFLPSCVSPCLQAFWQAGDWCWLPERGGLRSEAWVSTRFRCASLMAGGVCALAVRAESGGGHLHWS